jgi:fatty-acyl-CoA synthase
MDNLMARRKTEITITNSESKKLLGNKYIFDGTGRLESDSGNLTPLWLLTELQSLVQDQPHISGTEIVEIRSQRHDAIAATALVERYIDITLSELLDITAERYPNKEAIVDISAGARMTYSALNAASDHLAKKIIDLGTNKGDIIGLVMLNSIEQLISKSSILKTGAVIVNISPYEKELGLKTLLLRTDVKILILKPGVKAEETIDCLYRICPELYMSQPGQLHSPVLPKLRTIIIAGSETRYPGTLRFEDLFLLEPLCSDRQLEKRFRTITFRDIATIIHTSGTTNVPKSVMLTHGAIVENAQGHMTALDITERDRIFTPVPIFHALGCIGACITSLIAGATIVLMDKPKTAIALKVLQDEKCTVIFAVPSYYIALIETINEIDFDTTGLCLKLCVMAGAECSEKTICDVQSLMGSPEVLVMYGMTEAGPGITSTHRQDPLEIKKNTVGTPWPGIKIKLIDQKMAEDGRFYGEICVNGYNVMQGYYNDQAATSCAIDEEGWLHTGDLGCIREDGNLVIRGRTKDIITRNGENISPKEVENFLETHPCIAEAYVVGARDYKCGEDIYAFVKVKRGESLNERELIDYCCNKLATIKIPSHICFVTEFARANTGKVLRKELRAIAQEIHNKEKP